MLTVLTGVLLIAALIGVHALALYAIWWAVMVAVSRLPMIGRRHRHRGWERLNEARSQSPRPK